jgi:hypothetical protein
LVVFIIVMVVIVAGEATPSAPATTKDCVLILLLVLPFQTGTVYFVYPPPAPPSSKRGPIKGKYTEKYKNEKMYKSMREQSSEFNSWTNRLQI